MGSGEQESGASPSIQTREDNGISAGIEPPRLPQPPGII